MSKKQASGDKQIDSFRKALARLVDIHDLPSEMVGDLSDLDGTLHRGMELLDLLLTDLPPGDAASKLLELEILISDDLPMISRDLLPALRKVRKAAYAAHGPKRRESGP